VINVFGYTIIVKKDSLLKADPQPCDFEFNEWDDDICGICVSNWSNVQENISILENLGMVLGEDFVVYSSSEKVCKDKDYNDISCEWLEECEKGYEVKLK